VKSKRRSFVAAVLGTLLWPLLLGAQIPRPELQIERAFNNIVENVEIQRNLLEQDPCAAYGLVDKHLRDQFDWVFLGRYILREHWPTDSDQQTRFVEAFYDHLVEDYADLLIHFDSETLRVTRFDEDPPPESAYLQMQVTMNSGEKVPFALRMRVIDGGWRIIDVKPKTFSYVSDFHDNFRVEIFEVGLDGLIARLEEEAAQRRLCGQ
jgi:phospholipid transport system substrate-binding protein